MAPETAQGAFANLFTVNHNERKMPMSMKQMEEAPFEALVKYKIALRRKGMKDGVRYANVSETMKRRFGRD